MARLLLHPASRAAESEVIKRSRKKGYKVGMTVEIGVILAIERRLLKYSYYTWPTARHVNHCHEEKKIRGRILR